MTKYYLSHHGIKGQRWGVRRYQNEDGTLTPAGEKRYGTVDNMQETRARNKKRAIGVGIGIGAAAAVTGGVILSRNNKKLKKELGGYKAKEAKQLENLAKGRATRLANIANGIKKPKKYNIPPGADVVVSAKSKKGLAYTKEMFDVAGGTILKKAAK